jgi:hypothetical protein
MDSGSQIFHPHEGFILSEGDQAPKALLPDELDSHMHDIYITEREIQSQSNVLAKGLVLVQTGWFVMQCVARGVCVCLRLPLDAAPRLYSMYRSSIAEDVSADRLTLN